MNTSERNIYVFLRNIFGTICQNMIPHLFKAVLVGVARKTTEEMNAAMCLGDPTKEYQLQTLACRQTLIRSIHISALEEFDIRKK